MSAVDRFPPLKVILRSWAASVRATTDRKRAFPLPNSATGTAGGDLGVAQGDADQIAAIELGRPLRFTAELHDIGQGQFAGIILREDRPH